MAVGQPNENLLRDYIADRLDMVEAGLTLVGREHYLKNARGAAGFLDIFARDSFGRLVIIELKRTDSSAREAIQELFKYAALLRERYLIRDIEYRLILLSVEWHELLVPYSEMKKTAFFDLSAGRIVLDANGWPVDVEPVEAIATAAPRRFSKRHFLWRFEDGGKADAAAPLIAARMTAAGLRDFVLVRCRANDERLRGNVFLYFAHQELTLKEYRQSLRRQLSSEAYNEFEEQIADLTEEEDRVGEAADAVWLPGYDELFERIDSDYSEISHPEKASHWFKEGSLAEVEVMRFGRFNDVIISDDKIIEELIGQGGASDFLLRSNASTVSPPQMAALRAAVSNIFFFNPEWRNACLDLLTYAEKTGPANVTVAAFSNEDILRSIAGAAFRYPGYVPTFRLEIARVATAVETFMGVPEWDGSTIDFDSVREAHFGDDPFAYFMACHFGENRGLNADLMHDLGLRYIVFRMGKDGPEAIRVVGSSIIASPRKIRGSVFALIEANIPEVHKIVSMFMEHDQGFQEAITAWVNDPPNLAERELESRLEGLVATEEERYWNGAVGECQTCGHSLAAAQFMIDAHIGGGANVCALCYLAEGDGRGTIFLATGPRWRMLGRDGASRAMPEIARDAEP
ncbi:hypothetical protein M2341_001314 [Sphingobium sp. B7D2B]|uniref:endonuclease NucS domain-containing protein n=1 Tax=Sphingobium sp. B7D2B TaxID=2940583 RepID=UPI0022251EAD|nr:endonuclease NucS domain-containing protein [Sphingobium sp. B7D2B]MCW2365867.1 hypothetical protein [Sphingobium sp. B7D2B]